jgi:hypothetical protein
MEEPERALGWHFGPFSWTGINSNVDSKHGWPYSEKSLTLVTAKTRPIWINDLGTLM